MQSSFKNQDPDKINKFLPFNSGLAVVQITNAVKHIAMVRSNAGLWNIILVCSLYIQFKKITKIFIVKELCRAIFHMRYFGIRVTRCIAKAVR